MDWSGGKPHRHKEHHYGPQADLWPCDYQVPDAAFPAVIRGRAVLLHGGYQHHKTEDLFTEINTQTPHCYKYIVPRILLLYKKIFVCVGGGRGEGESLEMSLVYKYS